ncbi:hypothetical protein R83H12_02235 [Fibrobacteria bacterium R8-3-H12]
MISSLFAVAVPEFAITIVPSVDDVFADVTIALPDTVIFPVEVLLTALPLPVFCTVPPLMFTVPVEVLLTALPLPVFCTVPPLMFTVPVELFLTALPLPVLFTVPSFIVTVPVEEL